MKKYRQVIIISAALCTVILSIFIPNIYFKIKDNVTLGRMEKQSMGKIDLTVNSNLGTMDKIKIISGNVQILDLTSEDDPSEHKEFSLMFDDALAELNKFFSPWDVSFNESDVTSVEIYKYLYTSEDSAEYSFTGWEFVVNYPTFTVSMVLDYDTMTILKLNLSDYPVSTYNASEEKASATDVFDYDTAITYLTITEMLQYNDDDTINNILYNTLTNYYDTDVSSAYSSVTDKNDNTFVYTMYDDSDAPFNYDVRLTDTSISFN